MQLGVKQNPRKVLSLSFIPYSVLKIYTHCSLVAGIDLFSIKHSTYIPLTDWACIYCTVVYMYSYIVNSKLRIVGSPLLPNPVRIPSHFLTSCSKQLSHELFIVRFPDVTVQQAHSKSNKWNSEQMLAFVLCLLFLLFSKTKQGVNVQSSETPQKKKVYAHIADQKVFCL